MIVDELATPPSLDDSSLYLLPPLHFRRGPNYLPADGVDAVDSLLTPMTPPSLPTDTSVALFAFRRGPAVNN